MFRPKSRGHLSSSAAQARTVARRPPPPPSSEWAYFLDVDGTLLDLAPAPSLVRVDADLHGLIDQLVEFAGGAVALISGRMVADIDAFFPDRNLPVAGQHGLEHRNAAGRAYRHEPPPEEMRYIHDTIMEAVAAHPELVVEFKGLCIALHYRQAPRLGSFAHRLVRTVQERLGSEYTTQSGKYLVELKPSARNKGLAVRDFLSEPPFAGRKPVFLGDDVTDEFAFRVVNELGGYSIKVGRGRTVARYRLRDVQAVREWLAAATHAPASSPPRGRGRR
jgi:trehalose 6-phosphate phosphatase